VAIESLRADGTIRRAAILDLDVHQGDGTAAIFAADPGVLTISFHGRNNFPFRKQRSKVDVEFENGTGDAEYLARLPEALTEVERFRPEIVFYLSGVDALATDRLGKLSLTPQGMRRRDELVLDAFLGRYPLVITLGGGYSEPIDATVAAHAETFLLAAGGSLLRTSNGDAPDS
jgi:acetoin utilization deacetylase AcuC-like enzyme